MHRFPAPRSAAATALALAALTAAATAQRQFDTLPSRGFPADGDDTRDTLLADVDADGDLDLICGNSGQNRLYLNDGMGNFTDVTQTKLPLGSVITASLAMADVDGDGDPDLALGMSGLLTGQNRLFVNDGTGRFLDLTATNMPARITGTSEAIAFGDVDGDGDQDLVVGNRYATQDLYLNDGTGVFTDVTASHMPPNSDVTRDLALGDVDADGDLDIVCAARGTKRLYFNDGRGRFYEGSYRLPATGGNSWSMALGDFDNDRDLDVVFGDEDACRLYLNDGLGNFTAATGNLPAVAGITRAIESVDLDGDGDLDLLLGGDGHGQCFLNDGRARFSDATANRLPNAGAANAISAGDVDGDGSPDLVFGSYGANRLYVNDGMATLRDVIRNPGSPAGGQVMAVGDVDGDGDPDAVVGAKSGSWRYGWYGVQNRLFLNDGQGEFADATAAKLPVLDDVTSAVALGDVDGDGDLDLVVGNEGGYQRTDDRLYLNDGTGSFTDHSAHLPPGIGAVTTSVALGDVDRDGDLDLLLGTRADNYGSAQNRLFLNDGSGRFRDATSTQLPVDSSETTSVALGDVDGDGDVDAVLGLGFFTDTQNLLWLNDGTGTFTDATASHLPAVLDITHAVTLSDLDGDGDLDLLVGNQAQDRYYLNDGTGHFTDVTATHLPADPHLTKGFAVADVDEDGDPDLVLGKAWFRCTRGGGCFEDATENRLFINDGQGVFTDATARIPDRAAPTTAVALTDLDGDGDADLLIPNEGIAFNLRRQLALPEPLWAGHDVVLEVYSSFGPPSANTLAVTYLSTRRRSIPIPGLGTLGIDLMIGLPPIAITPASGMGSYRFPMPTVPGLGGTEIFAQALVLSVPVEARLSNVAARVVLR